MSGRAVLFDVGDTLVRRPEIGPGRRIADALGLGRDAARTITGWLFREAFPSPRALADRLRVTFALDRDVEEPVTAIWRAQETEPVEVAGASECVAAVRSAGAGIAIVSNIWAPYEAGFRRACPAIVPLVDSWHLSYRLGVAKPDPALFRAALAALDVAPADAVMVGDSVDKDIRPALALGIAAIRIPAATSNAKEPIAAATTSQPDGSSARHDPDDSVPVGATVARDLDDARRMLLAWLGGAPTLV